MVVGAADVASNELARRVRENQTRLGNQLDPHYDFVVCGAGSAGCVIAARLAKNPDTSVLLLEAGGSDDVQNVTDAALWPTNLASPTDWAFQAEPNTHLNGRTQLLSMGKVLGGGSSINVMAWARGHKTDWDLFAAESGNEAWCYGSVLDIYQRVEDWQGSTDPRRRGTGGPVFVRPALDPSPSASAILEAASDRGVATFDNFNGQMMEEPCGAARAEMIIRDGRRQSIFRSYTYPYMDQPNLTVLTNAIVRRVTFDEKCANGVEFSYRDEVRHVTAGAEVVLSLGAIHTPKVLMLSGVGDQNHLRENAIPVVQHLPGVGGNLQDHVAVTCVWESAAARPVQQFGDAVILWPSSDGLATPEWFAYQGSSPFASPDNIARFGMPDAGWMLHGALTRPHSRGFIKLRSADPADDVRIVHNGLSDPKDLALTVRCVETLRELGNSAILRPHTKREVMPGKLTGEDLVSFVRDGALTCWHMSGTAKMGRDSAAVVDGNLKVYGVDNLRVADASIMPNVTSANTMAPCVIIGERAAADIMVEHRL